MKLASGLFAAGVLLLGLPEARAQIAVGASTPFHFTAAQVEHAVGESTLDQSGTPPFHLVLQFAPANGGVTAADHTGTVEYWWVSPTQWRREIKTAAFHDVEIENGSRLWDKHEGDFFPVWLQKIAKAAIRPLPLPAADLAAGLARADTKYLMGTANFDWAVNPAIDDQRSTNKAYIQLQVSTGLINYTGGPDWDGEYKDFEDFHGKPIARQVSANPVTGTVTVLEDLAPQAAGFFDAAQPGGNAHPLDSIVLDTDALRKNLVTEPQFTWPDVMDGPFDGEISATLVIDQTGKVRDIGYIVADNQDLRAAALKGFQTLAFKPFTRNGVPVQVIGRYAVQFKAHRPAGAENFAPAKTYLDRANSLSFLHSAGHKPYHLTATIAILTPTGPKTGAFEETWLDETHYRQDLTFGSVHLALTHDGNKAHRLVEGMADGPAVGTFEQIIRLTSPIPPTNTLYEGDFCVRRGQGSDKDLIAILGCSPNARGGRDLNPNGAIWVNDKGEFVRSSSARVEIQAKNPQAYDGANLPRELDVYTQGRQIITITVTKVEPVAPGAPVVLDLPDHPVTSPGVQVVAPLPGTSN